MYDHRCTIVIRVSAYEQNSMRLLMIDIAHIQEPRRLDLGSSTYMNGKGQPCFARPSCFGLPGLPPHKVLAIKHAAADSKHLLHTSWCLLVRRT